MKTRAFDPIENRWRTDYVIAADGTLWAIPEGCNVGWSRYSNMAIGDKVNWKLSRFTGLCEIDYVDIWEYDVLVDDALNYYHVVFDNASFYVKRNSEPVRLLSDMVHSLWAYGNSLENPELLEV